MIIVVTYNNPKAGWYDGDNFIPLTKMASLQKSKFGINTVK